MFRVFKKISIPLLVILLVASFLRFFWMDRIPNAISGDELTYVFTAKSVQLTGTDISGTWSPWQGFMFKYPPGDHQAELPYFFVLPFVGVFGNSLFWIRFPYAFMGILIVLFLYLVTKRLFGEHTGIVASAFAAINPWFIYMSRTTYEMIPATLFYLISLYFMLDKEKKRIYTAIPFLLLAFYSYIGTKLIFIPFIFLVVFYAIFVSRQRKLTFPYISLIGIGVGLVSFFIFMQQGGNGSRMGELFLPNDISIQQAVDSTRKATIQNPMLSLLVNKGTVYIWTLIGKTFSVISPSYLFFEGDLFFALWHGFLYPIDSVFVAFGIMLLIVKKKHLGIFFLLLLLISVIPQIFHKNPGNFSSHTTLLIPLLIMLSAYGFAEIITLLQYAVYKRIIISLCLLLYSIFLLNFLHTYFFRSQLEEFTGFDMRTLSRYLKIARGGQSDVFVISSGPSDVFKKYLFYTNSVQKNSIQTLKKNFREKNYSFNGITFLPCESVIPQSGIIIIDSGCKEEVSTQPYLNISRLKDGGTQYKIYNDTICSDYVLKSFPFSITVNDFLPEAMPEKQFCETFITKFN